MVTEGLHSSQEVPMLLLDAEPSRKERGHRGVRPCHPNWKAFGLDGRVPRAAWDRVISRSAGFCSIIRDVPWGAKRLGMWLAG
jgi:hypothetical protein